MSKHERAAITARDREEVPVRSQPLIVQKYLQWVSYVSVVTNVCHFVVEV